ncbi:MAG TPA: FAD-dependent oxidoreductase [Patescibacteria group bacterium]
MANKKNNKNKFNINDLIVIGAGAAGLSAAIYAGRYLMKTVVFSKEFGGETATAGKIWNYPGFKSIDGYELVKKMKDQAESLGAKIINSEVIKIKKKNYCFFVTASDKKEYVANSVILAVGAERRKLGLPNEKELTGRGVHYCVTCDGPLFSGKTVGMVGGGDSSVKGVNLLGQYVKKIYLIVREKEIMAEPINYKQMKRLGSQVEVLLETEVKKLFGRKKLEKIVLSKARSGKKELKLDGLFIEIGAVPDVELAQSLGVQLDDHGYIKTDNLMKTNVDGVFAAGDTVNLFGRFKQDITAAAMGAVAATSAYEDYKEHGELCYLHMKPTEK